ncbi:MAG: YbaB/EbfC family nucleoid-associated protein [Phycisphaerales bacterium]|nr:YbaB/EbfC family nucleoid-associated protein [Phycisphaerales bacterium]
MFDNFKAMGAIAGLMKNKERLAEAGERVRDRLQRTKVTGEAQGGLVRVVVTGELLVESIEVAPALGAGFASDDRSMAEALVVEATNNAIHAARDRMQEIIREEASALGIELPPEIGRFLT